MKKLLAAAVVSVLFSVIYAEEPCYYYGEKLTCLNKVHVDFSIESNSYVKSVSIDGGQRLPLTGEIGVVFKKGVGKKIIDGIIEKYSFKIARTLDGIEGYFIFKAPENTALFEISRKLFETGLVKWAQPVWIEKPVLAFVPNDTYYGDQWQHKVINSETAWDIGQGYADAKIAVLDSGVDTMHPDLFLQLGMSFVPGEPQIDPNMGALQNKYYMAHGTAVSGIAAGQGDNGIGVSGVCPKCSVIPVKYIGLEMSNPPADRKLNAVKWAVDAGAWVINNSWTIAPDKDKQTEECIDIPLDNFVKEMTDYAVNTGRNGLGTIIVWAAGNSTCDTVRNPSLLDERNVVVSGLDIDSTLVYYSNYGVNVDISAPAGDADPAKSGLITTDVTANGKGFNPAFNDANSGYTDYMDQAYTKYFDGTSAAAPVVAGALALMLSVNPSMTYAQAIDCMKKAASVPEADCSYGEKSVCFGAGILNAGKMVELASSGECGGEPLEVEDDEQTPDESVEEPESDIDTESPDNNEQIQTPDSSPVVDEEEKSDNSDTNEQPDNAAIPEDESTGCSALTI
jgi:hypothetical protein